MATPHPLLIAGIAALFFLSRKKGGSQEALKPGPVDGTAETPDGAILGGEDVPEEVTEDLKQQGVTQEQVDQALALPKLESSNQVVFNAARTEFKIGPTWRYATLDSWLNTQREAGWLETKTDEAVTFTEQTEGETAAQIIDELWANANESVAMLVGMGSTALLLDAMLAGGLFVSVPISTAAIATGGAFAYALEAAKLDDWPSKASRLERTAALALMEFVKSHNAIVGPERKPVPIIELGITPATVDFMSVIANYIVRFQASSYE